MTFLGWTVLALVFVDEVLAVAAFGYWGWHHDPRWLLAWLLPILAASAWFWFASPKARYGGHLRRPLVKVAVFGLASLALWDADQATAAAALLVFSIAVNALAQIPSIAALPDEISGTRPPAGR